MFGIGGFSLSKSLAGTGKNSAISGQSGSTQDAVRTMISQRIKKTSTIFAGKKSKFDKIIEKDMQKKQQPISKKKHIGVIEEDLKLCKSQRKLGVCTEGEKCPYAHSIEDIKYYRP